MDSTQDSLSSSGKLSQERNNEERRLTIKTGSRFIQEEESTAGQQKPLGGMVDLRFTDKLDTDGETFPLLDA